MRAVFKYEKIDLTDKDGYNKDSYPHEGVFEDELGNIWVVSKLSAIFLCRTIDIDMEVVMDESDQQPGQVSESLFLKTVAIMSGNVKKVEI